MQSFHFPKDRQFLLQRMGDISQLAGTKPYRLAAGKAQGVEAVDIKTGSGFAFTVLPGRGLDIAWADYRGVPIGYMSKTGVVAPAYYESDGMEWLRSFGAGLLTTCGLSNVGGPCQEDDPVLGTRHYGLHGRIANMAAEQVSVREAWEDDELVMTVSGYLREACLHGEHLTLRRTVTAKLGENRLRIHDEVENAGFSAQPLMLLYHINLGYPLLDDGSRFVCASREIVPAADIARDELEQYAMMGPPVIGALERVYFHAPSADADGMATVALINDRLEFGAYVRFNTGQLPRLTQWKQLGAAEYVLGIEPGNCLPISRAEHRTRGDLEMIRPGEQRVFDVEIGVLPDHEAIVEVEQLIHALPTGNR